MEGRNSNVKQRRILLTFFSVIETFTEKAGRTQKRHFSFRHWNHSCVIMIPNIDVFIANITSASKKEDFEFHEN